MSAFVSRPFLAPVPQRPPQESPREGFYAGAIAGATALLVDDDEASALALSVLLGRGGLTTLAANSGWSALQTLDARTDVQIVLMDIMMPLMDGYETMTEIRKRPECAALPIIAVTGKDADGERERCVAAGASDYVPKPIDTPKLLTAIFDWLPPGGQLQGLTV
jgi:CheY-like chemotaxis protein